jgi:hypothetical protein
LLTKRKITSVEKGRHGFNPDIVVYYELQFNGEIMKPGEKFKIKNDSKTYIFQCFAHNITLDSSWIDAMCLDTGEFRSFRVDRIKGLVRKKSRVKKNERNRIS